MIDDYYIGHGNDVASCFPSVNVVCLFLLVYVCYKIYLHIHEMPSQYTNVSRTHILHSASDSGLHFLCS
jgi:hypothetical protein